MTPTSAGAPVMDLFPPIGPATHQVVFHGFETPGRPASPEEWAADHDEIIEQRLAGVALRCIKASGAQPPQRVIKNLEEAQFAWSCVTRDAVVASAAALAALRSSDIPFAVSKGPGIAVANTQLQDRPFSDLDLLIAPKDFERVIELLAGAGFDEVVASHQPWPWFDRWCREAINLRADNGGSVDIHHHIPPWYWTKDLRIDRLIAGAKPVRIFGQELPCVAAEHNLIISALHIVSDRNRAGRTLMAWRDLLTMATVTDVGVARAEAEAAGLVGWLLWVLRSLPEHLRPAALVSALEQSPSPSLPGQRRLRHLGPDAIGSRHLVGQALRLPLLQGTAFIAGMAVPSPRFLRERFPDDRHRYLSWWRGAL